MSQTLLIRPERPADYAAVAELNRLAFNGAAEADFVARLRRCESFIPELSLVAKMADAVVGHLVLSRVAVRTRSSSHPALALAPVAVLPDCQNCGIGSRLVEHALAEARRLGHDLVIVLGHPRFYPRFGFIPASRCGVQPPFKVPDEVFMLAWLGAGDPPDIAGVVQYPPAFEGV